MNAGIRSFWDFEVNKYLLFNFFYPVDAVFHFFV